MLKTKNSIFLVFVISFLFLFFSFFPQKNLLKEEIDSGIKKSKEKIISYFPLNKESEVREEFNIEFNEKPPNKSSSYLSGEVINNSDEERFIGVMIEESITARGLYQGLEKGKWFFEIPTEGGVPRMLVIFSNLDFPEKAGPVRSARPYFIEIAEPIVSSYVHIGGSPVALEMLYTANFNNIDEYIDKNYIERNQNIHKPHNAFLVFDNLLNSDEFKQNQKIKDFAIPLHDKKPNGDIKVKNLSVNFSTDRHSVSWQYNEKNNCYKRIQEYEKLDICAKNIIIIKTNIGLIEGDDKGRLLVRTTGSGDVKIFNNGNKAEGKWKRSTDGIFKFYDAEENLIKINKGITFFQFLDTFDKLITDEK